MEFHDIPFYRHAGDRNVDVIGLSARELDEQLLSQSYHPACRYDASIARKQEMRLFSSAVPSADVNFR